MCPEEDDYILLRGLEVSWRRKLPSPYDLYNTISNDPSIIDELPVWIGDLFVEKVELEEAVRLALTNLQTRTVAEQVIAEEFFIYPKIKRIIVIDAAIARMKHFWFSYYHFERDSSYRKGMSETELQQARNSQLAIIAEKLGLRLQRGGRNPRCICPFHQEKTPSLTLFASTNTWHCFGCHAGGDGITLVRKLLGHTFPQAVRFIIT